ncbi:MAG: hypothetical protein M1820_002234 [Bogoriella megaspora]|nr:MAG: hypothetical protein M1820_002234 [Bogoriella megaspora]
MKYKEEEATRSAEITIQQQGKDVEEYRARVKKQWRTVYVGCDVVLELGSAFTIKCNLDVAPVEPELDVYIDGVLQDSQMLQRLGRRSPDSQRMAVMDQASYSLSTSLSWKRARTLQVCVSVADELYLFNESSREPSEAKAISELGLKEKRPGFYLWAVFTFNYHDPSEVVFVKLPYRPSRSLCFRRRRSQSMSSATAITRAGPPTATNKPSAIATLQTGPSTTISTPNVMVVGHTKIPITSSLPSATATSRAGPSTTASTSSATAIPRAEPPTTSNMQNITARSSNKRPASPNAIVTSSSKYLKLDLNALQAELQQAKEQTAEANYKRDAAAALVDMKKASLEEANDNYRKQVKNLQERIQEEWRQAQLAEEERAKLEKEAEDIEKETSSLIERDVHVKLEQRD